MPPSTPTTQAPARQEYTPEQEFARRVSATANKQLQAILGTDAGKKAAHTITMAMLAAMRTTRDPKAFLQVTDASIAGCVSTSYETQLFPGGPNPTVYLVPQAPRKGEPPELQWRITHRGLAILAARAGYGVMVVPVHTQDMLNVAFGEAIEHSAAPDAWPEKLSDILGVIVVVRRISDGVTISRAWMPLQAIDQRRRKSRDGSVWSEWPVEMAQKTGFKWAFARGYVPLDSPEMQSALSADGRGDIIEGTAEVIGTTSERRQSVARAAIAEGLPAGNAPMPDPVEHREEVRVEAPDPLEQAAIIAAERQAAAGGDEGMA